MSAIFGFLYRDGRETEQAHLDRMSWRLSHRGPDADGTWSDKSVGLGQRILQTTPESFFEGGPLVQAGGRLALVADARIDNRDELIPTLGLRRAAEGITDSEVILAAYRKWGRSAPEKLIGDFAFAIWDAERDALFCARDPMGVRPFYYFASDRLFAFATELKGVFCLPEVPQELDEVQIAYFLDWFRDDRERTFYRGVRRLPAACWLEVDASRVRSGRFWAADPEREIRYSTDDEYVEAFREHFTEAVNCRLRSAKPIGSALSGGLDSSSIVCTARMLLDAERPFQVVSAEFPGLAEPYRKWNDESPYIDAVAQLDGIISHRVRADEMSLFGYLDRMFWHHDVPPFGFMYWMRWAVYEAAHQHGIRVLFSGDDGDTVVSHGFERFNDLAREGRWGIAVAELEELGRQTQTSPAALSAAYLNPRLAALARSRRWRLWREGSSTIARSFDLSLLQLMTRSALDAFVPERLIHLSRRLRGLKPGPSLVSSRFAQSINLDERKRRTQNVHADPIPTGRQSHALVLPSPMLQHIMEVTDSMGGAFSIETRCPFLDRRLVEFCLAIPSEQKLAHGWTRLILRRAMGGILPPEVQWRRDKADLGYNFVFSLWDRDRRTLRESLFDDPQVLEDYVDMDELRKVHRSFSAKDFKGARRDGGRLYIAAVLARWLRGARSGSEPEPATQRA